MKINIKKMTGETFPLDVGMELSVLDLKALIKEREQVDEVRQRLIYHGRVLKDGDMLSTYNIVENCVIHLVVRPENSPHSAGIAADAAPVTSDRRGPLVQPFQHIGNGVMMGSVSLDSHTGQQADLGGVFNQLFSTMGNNTGGSAASQPQTSNAARPRPVWQTPLATPPLPGGALSLRSCLEVSVANAEVVVAAAGRPARSQADGGSPADIDSNIDRIAIAQGLYSFNEALNSLSIPVETAIATLRTGDALSSRDRISTHRELETLHYLLTRLVSSAMSMSHAITNFNHATPAVGSTDAGTNADFSRVVQPITIDIGNSGTDDDDVDMGLSLPPMDYVNAGSTSSAPADVSGGLSFLNTFIPNLLNAAVSAFGPHLQQRSDMTTPANTFPTPQSEFSLRSAEDPVDIRSIEGASVTTPPSSSSVISNNTSGNENTTTVSSAIATPNAVSTPIQGTGRAPIRINISRVGPQRFPSVSVAGRPTVSNIELAQHHASAPQPGIVAGRQGVDGSTPLPRVPTSASQGVRYIYHHQQDNPTVYSPLTEPTMAEAIAVAGNALPRDNVRVSAPINQHVQSASVEAPVSGSAQYQEGLEPISVPTWVQQQMIQVTGPGGSFPHEGVTVRHVFRNDQSNGQHRSAVSSTPTSPQISTTGARPPAGSDGSSTGI